MYLPNQTSWDSLLAMKLIEVLELIAQTPSAERTAIVDRTAEDVRVRLAELVPTLGQSSSVLREREAMNTARLAGCYPGGQAIKPEDILQRPEWVKEVLAQFTPTKL